MQKRCMYTFLSSFFFVCAGVIMSTDIPQLEGFFYIAPLNVRCLNGKGGSYECRCCPNLRGSTERSLDFAHEPGVAPSLPRGFDPHGSSTGGYNC